MEFLEIYAKSTLETMCESFRNIVTTYGSPKDKKEVIKLDSKDFNKMIDQIKKDKLSDEDIKKCFLTQCVESYDFSDNIIDRAKKIIL